MNWTCLLVDIDQDGLRETWTEDTRAHEMGVALTYATAEEATPMLDTGSVAMLLIFAKEPSQKILQLLESFRTKVGAIGRFQAIVSDDPTPQYMAQVYEYSIEQYMSRLTWPQELAALSRDVVAILSDPNSPESACIKINRSIAQGDQGVIIEAERELGDAADYDYLAAYHKGKACEATGRFSEAISAFQASTKMNKMFRPSNTGLGENLLITGRVDEAIAVFEKLEKTNPWDVSRKINLASAFMEKGDFTKAKEFIREAAKVYPNHPRIAEAKVQILLAAGKINDAFQMMDKLSDVGPYFAAKLNDMGIKLSQAGKGKVALALYAKAHKIVRSDLRYKISLNTALACHRLQDFQTALKYLNRCEKEYGSSFEKLLKIRAAIKAALVKQKTIPKAAV